MNFDYGNVLTRTFQINWKHKSFSLFLLLPTLVISFIVLLFIIPVFILEENNADSTLIFIFWAAVMVIGAAISLVTFTVGTTSLMLGLLRVERDEGDVSFMELLRDGFAYFGRALGIVLIVQLTVGAVFTIFFLCIVLLSAVTMGLATLCLQPVILMISPFSLLVLAVMNGGLIAFIGEDLNPLDAVKRALGVVRMHVWKFIILSVILYIVQMLLSSLIFAPAMIPFMGMSFASETGMNFDEPMLIASLAVFFCLFFGAAALFNGISGALMNTALGLAYLRLSRPVENEIVYAETQKGSLE